MSGNRQHYIPRFLLEGFASHVKGGEVYTWVYRKKSRPFNPNITKVGVGLHFYAEGEDNLADDKITLAEVDFSSLVKDLRDSSATVVNDSSIPALIAHFEVRTRHIRETMSQSGHYIVSRFLDYMANEEFFIQFMIRSVRKDPSILRKPLEDGFKKKGIPKAKLETALKFGLLHLPYFLKQSGPEIRFIASYIRSVAPEILAKAAKSGHIRALKGSVSPELKVERYKELTYRIFEFPDGDLILGDSIILFQTEGARPFKAFLFKDDALEAVLLPLSSHKLLVGANGDMDISVLPIREAIAQCSLECFVANENSGRNVALQERIGEYASLAPDEELEKSVTDALTENLK